MNEPSKIKRLLYVYWMHFLKLLFGSYPNFKMTEEEKKIRPYIYSFLLLDVILLIFIGLYNDNNNLGTLGDFFQGIVGPFVGVFSAILVYRSFKIQTKANQMQLEGNLTIQGQWQFDTFLKLFSEIENKYQSLQITETISYRPFGASITEPQTKTEKIHKGYDYFGYIERYHKMRKRAVEDWLVAPNAMLEEYYYLIMIVHKSSISDKLLVYNKLNIFYTNYLEKPLHQLQPRFLLRKFRLRNFN